MGNHPVGGGQRKLYRGRLGPSRNVFVTKIDPSTSGAPSLLYSTYLGGDENDIGRGIAISSSDQVFLTGYTVSLDFPTANAIDDTCGAGACLDAFVTQLDIASNTLVYSTYLGGDGEEEGTGIAVDGAGSAYITGFTQSTDFPVVDAIQSTKGSDGCGSPPCADAFVTKVSPLGSALVYSTYLGGSGEDYGNAITLDGSGSAYITGETLSSDFHTTPGAYDTTIDGSYSDSFVTKISEPSSQDWTTTYTYTYDPLYRLTGANYSTGEYFNYSYDAVGNRLNETTDVGTTTYVYDIANRLTDVNGVTYTWDDNGNLLNDGVNAFVYDHANRLGSVVGSATTTNYAYNGLGDRLQQTVDSVTENYTLDLNNWLTQVLADGTNTYLYGTGRIAQYDAGEGEYFLGDAIGSVRQLTDDAGTVILAKSYQPFGSVYNSAGTANISYGFTGEWTDLNSMVYLRSRFYNPIIGRFLTKDSWQGDYYQPLTLNLWNYVGSNPINFVDPSGMFLCVPSCCEEWVISALVQLNVYGGPFSQLVVNKFNYLDRNYPVLLFFLTNPKDGFGAAPLQNVIILPNYIKANTQPTKIQIAHFAHEVVHQTQGFDRFTTWGEAQAYIYSGMIKEELGDTASDLEKKIITLAYDINSLGFTKHNLYILCKVREEILDEYYTLPYKIFPNLLYYLIFPDWKYKC